MYWNFRFSQCTQKTTARIFLDYYVSSSLNINITLHRARKKTSRSRSRTRAFSLMWRWCVLARLKSPCTTLQSCCCANHRWKCKTIRVKMIASWSFSWDQSTYAITKKYNYISNLSWSEFLFANNRWIVLQ